MGQNVRNRSTVVAAVAVVAAAVEVEEDEAGVGVVVNEEIRILSVGTVELQPQNLNGCHITVRNVVR